MPFIDTKLNFRLGEDQEKILKAKLGEAISGFPGKSEYWLMLNFTDNCRMWFRGYDQYPIAMVEVSLFGEPTSEDCCQMTKTITDIFQTELNISPDHIYIRYFSTPHWGWNGENF